MGDRLRGLQGPCDPVPQGGGKIFWIPTVLILANFEVQHFQKEPDGERRDTNMILELHNIREGEKLSRAELCPAPQDGIWAIFLTPVFLGFLSEFAPLT